MTLKVVAVLLAKVKLERVTSAAEKQLNIHIVETHIRSREMQANEGVWVLIIRQTDDEQVHVCTSTLYVEHSPHHHSTQNDNNIQ